MNISRNEKHVAVACVYVNLAKSDFVTNEKWVALECVCVFNCVAVAD